MNIQSVMLPGTIFFDKEFCAKQEVFDFIADAFLQVGIVDQKEPYVESLWYRESMGETGLEKAVAMPHGKSPAVTRPAIGYIRLKTPIAWEAIDENCQQAKHIFVLAIPETGHNRDHIRLLSHLATRLVKPEVISQLNELNDAQQLVELFSF